jgi:hypothetical protein
MRGACSIWQDETLMLDKMNPFTPSMGAESAAKTAGSKEISPGQAAELRPIAAREFGELTLSIEDIKALGGAPQPNGQNQFNNIIATAKQTTEQAQVQARQAVEAAHQQAPQPYADSPEDSFLDDPRLAGAAFNPQETLAQDALDDQVRQQYRDPDEFLQNPGAGAWGQAPAEPRVVAVEELDATGYHSDGYQQMDYANKLQNAMQQSGASTVQTMVAPEVAPASPIVGSLDASEIERQQRIAAAMENVYSIQSQQGQVQI